MSVILGINAFHAGASAALLVDGKPICAIAEERLNRVKYYAGFPVLAIQTCLAQAGLTIHDVEHVALGRDSSANLTKKIGYVLKHTNNLLNLLKTNIARSGLDNLRQLLADHFGVDPTSLRFKEHHIEHHIAHTASAYFASPWEKAAGFTMDGSGDFATCMLTECVGNQINVKHRVYVPHSLGSLYTMVCEFIGYDRYGDEGKVMGLAPYGDDTYEEYFSDMLQTNGADFSLNPKYFRPFGDNQGMRIDEKGQMVFDRHYSDEMVRLFGNPREPQNEISQRDMDLAYGVQHAFERGYMRMLQKLHDLVPQDRVVMAGGCVLNSVSNGKMFKQTPFRETFIQPAAGDDGLALGAALYVSQQILQDGPRFVMKDAYLGPAYPDEQIEKVLLARGLNFEKKQRPQLLEETAEEIVQGKIVGWFQGKSEWGPRALGNRSILVHPGFPGMKDILNARIKRREWFRPFAPAVLEEKQSDIFDHDHPSPFMLHVYKIRPEWRERLSAVNHVDNTGRLQTVNRENNELYYDLIQTFYQKTGIPVLLNTSFNENEPIVCTPEEAVDCFERTKMDVLAIGCFLCRKESA